MAIINGPPAVDEIIGYVEPWIPRPGQKVEVMLPMVAALGPTGAKVRSIWHTMRLVLVARWFWSVVSLGTARSDGRDTIITVRI